MKRFISILICLLIFLLSTACSGHSDPPLPNGVKADKVLIVKDKRQLILFKNNKELKTYRISLGRNPQGAKQKEGDKKTPEGNYTIDSRKPDSSYHLALHISYPNKEDIKGAQKQGVSPGGAIMIHGIRNGFGWVGGLHRFFDWTQGCIAVTNNEIEEIWRVVPDGTPIEIKP